MNGGAVLHICDEPGCTRLAFLAHCPQHSVPEDGDVRAALADAVAELALARDREREAWARLRALEAAAGIRRA